MTDPIDHCRDVARRRDRPRYLAALFLTQQARPAAFATLALNYELARIAEIVSEPLLGEMRLQWWREAIAATETPDNPVLQVLATTDLDKAVLTAFIDARAADLYPEPFPDLAALEAYAAATAGGLLVLWQHAGNTTAHDAIAAARAAGTAWGLMGLHAAAPYHAARGKTFLPSDTTADVIAERATMYLSKSGDLAKHLPQDARRALRLAVLGRRALRQLQRHGEDRQPRFDALDPLFLWLG